MLFTHSFVSVLQQKQRLHLDLFTFCRVEDTVGLSVANVASLGLAVMLKSAAFTEVMLTPGKYVNG